MTAGRRLVGAMTASLMAMPIEAAPAQETAPLVLRLPASPRAFGMGNGYTGGSGSEAVFYNPANIGRPNGLFVAIGRYAGASTQGGLASSTSLGKVTVALFGHWLDYATEVFPAGPGGLTIRGPHNGQSLAAGVALASVVKGFRIGAAAKYVEERTPAIRSGVAAFDVGVARDLGRLTVGLAAQHLGADLEIAANATELPTRVSLGATTRRLPISTYFDLRAAAAVARERDGRIAPAGGVELTYEPVSGWTAALRVGGRRVDRAGNPALRALTLGASLGLDRFAVDYGLERYRGAGTVHRVGVRIE